MDTTIRSAQVFEIPILAAVAAASLRSTILGKHVFLNSAGSEYKNWVTCYVAGWFANEDSKVLIAENKKHEVCGIALYEAVGATRVNGKQRATVYPAWPPSANETLWKSVQEQICKLQAKAEKFENGYHHMSFLGVNPAFQDQGVGKHLLDFVVAESISMGVPLMTEIAAADGQPSYYDTIKNHSAYQITSTESLFVHTRQEESAEKSRWRVEGFMMTQKREFLPRNGPSCHQSRSEMEKDSGEEAYDWRGDVQRELEKMTLVREILRPEIHIRDATYKDTAAAVALYVMTFLRDSERAKYQFRHTKPQDYRRCVAEMFESWIRSEEMKVQVAEDGGGVVRGIMAYSWKTKGTTTPDTKDSAPWFPASADMVFSRLRGDILNAWKTYTFNALGDHIFLLSLCVHPSAQRLGIASQLVKGVTDQAASAKVPVVLQTEPNAIRFYERYASANSLDFDSCFHFTLPGVMQDGSMIGMDQIGIILRPRVGTSLANDSRNRAHRQPTSSETALVKRTKNVTVRRATLGDASGIVNVVAASFRSLKLKSIEFKNTSDGDYRRWFAGRLETFITGPKHEVHVAVNDDGVVCGMIVFSLEGLATRSMPADIGWCPPSGNRQVRRTGKGIIQAWLAEVFDECGEYYHVAMLGVDPKSQGLGAGSKLMTVLGDRIRAEDGNRAIVLETESPGFYESFANKNSFHFDGDFRCSYPVKSAEGPASIINIVGVIMKPIIGDQGKSPSDEQSPVKV